ncbi:MAG: hypothetical protein AAFR98_05585 [Pseudomonadota bacterium]
MANSKTNEPRMGRRLFLATSISAFATRARASGEAGGFLTILTLALITVAMFIAMNREALSQAKVRIQRGLSLPLIAGYTMFASVLLFQMAHAQRRRTMSTVSKAEKLKSSSERRSLWRQMHQEALAELAEAKKAAEEARSSGKNLKALRHETTVSQLTVFSDGAKHLYNNPREGGIT